MTKGQLALKIVALQTKLRDLKRQLGEARAERGPKVSIIDCWIATKPGVSIINAERTLLSLHRLVIVPIDDFPGGYDAFQKIVDKYAPAYAKDFASKVKINEDEMENP